MFLEDKTSVLFCFRFSQTLRSVLMPWIVMGLLYAFSYAYGVFEEYGQTREMFCARLSRIMLFLCTCVCSHTHGCMSMSVCVCVCTCIHGSVFMCVCTCACACMDVCVRTACAQMHVRVRLCVWVGGEWCSAFLKPYSCNLCNDV